MADRISIHDLRLPVRIGVSDQERAEPRELRLDIEIDTDLQRAGTTDALGDTIDYGRVLTDVADLVRNGEAKLIENVAERVASHVVGLPGVQRVTVQVTKERPPVDEDVREVRVKIERTP